MCFIFLGTNESWKKLIAGEIDGNGTEMNNTTLENVKSIRTDNDKQIIKQLFFSHRNI